jgi:hypothetical protein
LGCAGLDEVLAGVLFLVVREVFVEEAELFFFFVANQITSVVRVKIK